ncbi:VOC family protein [Bradyrhizobium sp. Gha]|uniref:VOC family protein n=1 Tax=Bradyrhizobium sp. Gha TaxID=1855318 RepID=UPI0008E55E55|nr:hypothetical protein SAMN05216525_108183 [Bradyrhizobium sp. Gha]
MLGKAKVAARLPAKDLDRARRFYSEKLGLDPVEQRQGGLRYVCAAGEFAIFISAGAQPTTHTHGRKTMVVPWTSIRFARRSPKSNVS